MKNNKAQKCGHSSFYSIDDDVYCNYCHKYLGYFDPWKLGGFVKKTSDSIEDEYLNERTRKIDDGKIVKCIREKKKYVKPEVHSVRELIPPSMISRPCNPPGPGR